MFRERFYTKDTFRFDCDSMQRQLNFDVVASHVVLVGVC